MFLADPVLFSLSLLDTGAILFLLIYFVIVLSDLECDYLNAQECCSRLNTWVYPRLIAHVFLHSLLCVHGHWLLFFMNLPVTCWMVYEIITVPKGNMGLYDPTEIHNRGELKRHMRDCMVFLGFYLIIFFIYLYCMISSLLKGDPINRIEEGEMIKEM